MSQSKVGLHKGISEIFNDVSPRKDGDGSNTPEHQEHATMKPSVTNNMTPPKPEFEQSHPEKAALGEKSKDYTRPKIIQKILNSEILENIKNKLFASSVMDTRQKVTVILIPILFIVLIALFIRGFSTPSPRSAKAKSSEPTGAIASYSDSKLNWKIPKPYPETLRDPMQFGSASGHTGGLIVKGIVYSKDNPSAVIGNHIVHEGDKIMDVVITKINEDSVEFKANDKKWIQKVEK